MTTPASLPLPNKPKRPMFTMTVIVALIILYALLWHDQPARDHDSERRTDR
jgi:hypothetical protein